MGLSALQQAIIDGVDNEHMDSISSRDIYTDTKPTVEKAQVRSGFQGVTLGFADEIEAFARSMVETSSYEEIRDGIRDKLNAYQEAYPGEAISYELLGAVAPTALAYLSPIPGDEMGVTAYLTGRTADVAQKGANFMQKAKPVIKRGAAEGALAAYGTGEEDVVKDLTRIPMGAAMGTVFSGTTTALLSSGGALTNKVLTKANEMMGNKAVEPISVILQELVKTTGRSPDDVLRGIANGEIIADNATLHAVLKSLRADLGEDVGKIDTKLQDRVLSTRETAKDYMQEGMTPNVDGNVYKAYTVGDDIAKKQESKLYKGAFDNAQELTPEIVDSVADAIRRFPSARELLGEIYQAKGLVPFYKIADNGEVQIVRMPTLEDAEIVRRSLSESTSGAYSSGKGALGEPLSNLEKSLKQQLDDFSPRLKSTRQNASNIRRQRDAYKMGRGALSKPSDELAVDMENLIGVSPTVENSQVLKAFRMGAMNALRHKSKEPTYMRKVSEEGTKENSMMRTIFPEEKIEDLLEKAHISGQALNTKNVVLGGTTTSNQQQASGYLALATRAAQGDPSATLGLVSNIVKDLTPEMSHEQRTSLIQLLISEDPDFVRKALVDNSLMSTIQDKLGKFTGAFTRGAERAVQFESGKEGGDIGTGLMNLFGK
jgi:hypothetical protein